MICFSGKYLQCFCLKQHVKDEKLSLALYYIIRADLNIKRDTKPECTLPRDFKENCLSIRHLDKM